MPKIFIVGVGCRIMPYVLDILMIFECGQELVEPNSFLAAYRPRGFWPVAVSGLFEGPDRRPVRGEEVLNLLAGAVLVSGNHLDNEGGAARSISFIAYFFKIRPC